MYGANTLHNLDERGLSCLDMAVEAQSSSVVEYLISQDLRASGPKQDDSTTLGTAILLMDGSSGPEIVRMLVDHGGASATEIMDEGMTPLHLIAASDTCWLHKNDLVKAFLEKSALVGARDWNGRTPSQTQCNAAAQSSAVPFASTFATLMRHTTDVEIDSLNDDGALRIIADRWSEGYRPSAEDIQESSATFLSALLQLLERSSIDGIIATGQKSFDLLAEALYRKENSVIESIVRTLERVSADQINASHFILVEACCVYG
jgi:ankyrin repeat protein